MHAICDDSARRCRQVGITDLAFTHIEKAPMHRNSRDSLATIRAALATRESD